MALVARTWVEGEVGTAAKLNTIRDDLIFLNAGMGIKTLQYVSFQFTGGGGLTNGFTDITLGIAVNQSKTIPYNCGAYKDTGPDGTPSADHPGVWTVNSGGTTIRLQLRAGTIPASAGTNWVYRCCVVEYNT